MKFIGISDNTSNMDSHSFNFFFVFCTNVNKYGIHTRLFLFSRFSRMNCWPSKNTFNNAFFCMNIYNFTRPPLSSMDSVAL